MKRKEDKKKVVKGSTAGKSKQAGPKEWTEYTDIFNGDYYPVSQKKLAELALELVQWARTNEDALKVGMFHLEKGIPIGTWSEWIEKFKVIRDAVAHAKMIIGHRREHGAIKNKYNANIISYTMPIYDPEWKAEAERRAALRESSNESKSSVVVHMSPIADSPLVPDRKKKDGNV